LKTTRKIKKREKKDLYFPGNRSQRETISGKSLSKSAAKKKGRKSNEKKCMDIQRVRRKGGGSFSKKKRRVCSREAGGKRERRKRKVGRKNAPGGGKSLRAFPGKKNALFREHRLRRALRRKLGGKRAHDIKGNGS